MNRQPEITEEHVAAAQLRIVLDNKLGRQTPDVIRRIAEMIIGDPSRQEATSRQMPTSRFLSGESREEQMIRLLRALQAAQPEAEDYITSLHAIPERFAEVERRRWSQQVADESDITAMAKFAAALVAAGDVAAAERVYRRAVDAGDSKALANLAALLVAAGRAEEAEGWFRRASTDT